jgi:hypothetical protein
MSDHQQGPGWWLASDGRWYPPQHDSPVAARSEPSLTGKGASTAKRTRWISAVVGAVVIIIGAISFLVAAAPDTSGFSGKLDAAMTESQLNENSADSAPKQQVVNGWVARDLAHIQVEQNNAELRLMYELGIAVVALIVLTAWTNRDRLFRHAPPGATS